MSKLHPDPNLIGRARWRARSHFDRSPQNEAAPRGEYGSRGEGMGPMGHAGPMSRCFAGSISATISGEQVRALFEEVEGTGVSRAAARRRASLLHDAIESGADESTLRQQATQLGEVEGDAAVEFARVRARIQEILTAEQKKELEQLKKEAEERREMHQRQREERKERRSGSGADPL